MMQIIIPVIPAVIINPFNTDLGVIIIESLLKPELAGLRIRDIKYTCRMIFTVA